MRKSNLAGFSYHLELPKDIRGSFHPKVGMGITEKGLLLMVGSHNLTESAFKSNLELTAIESISIVDQHQELLESVAGFLKNLESHTRTSSPSKDLLQSIQFALMDYGSGGSRRTSAFFLHSYERPIIDQVLDKIEDPVGIKVLVPTHSQNDEWVQGFIEMPPSSSTQEE